MHWTAESDLPAFLLPPTKWLGNHAFGCDVDAARPVDEISKVRRPMLLIHGDGDPITPVEHAHRLRHAAGGWARLWVSRSDRHAGVYFVDPRVYLDTVAAFFDACLN